MRSQLDTCLRSTPELVATVASLGEITGENGRDGRPARAYGNIDNSCSLASATTRPKSPFANGVSPRARAANAPIWIAWAMRSGFWAHGPEVLRGSSFRTERSNWAMRPDEDEPDTCPMLALSKPEDRVWCADFSGVIRGRSLTTGELDGTTVEHPRGYLASLDLLDADQGRYLITMGGNSASIGRWRVDGLGPISHKIAAGHDGAGYSPDGRWMLLGAPANDGTDGFTLSLWTADTDQQVTELTTPGIEDVVWLGDGRVATLSEGGRSAASSLRSPVLSARS